MGVLAFGDSITNAGGELQWGVALQSWALWLARALGCPTPATPSTERAWPTSSAEQIPAFRARNADAEARYDVGCLYIGVNDVRALDWDPAAFAAAMASALAFLAERCDRVADRHRAAAARGAADRRQGRASSTRSSRRVAAHGALVVDLADSGPATS